MYRRAWFQPVLMTKNTRTKRSNQKLPPLRVQLVAGGFSPPTGGDMTKMPVLRGEMKALRLMTAPVAGFTTGV